MPKDFSSAFLICVRMWGCSAKNMTSTPAGSLAIFPRHFRIWRWSTVPAIWTRTPSLPNSARRIPDKCQVNQKLIVLHHRLKIKSWIRSRNDDPPPESVATLRDAAAVDDWHRHHRHLLDRPCLSTPYRARQKRRYGN